MLSTMAKGFFAQSPALFYPVLALILFVVVFVAITVRTLRRDKRDIDEHARIPLADSAGRREQNMNGESSFDSIQGQILHEYDGILEADNQLPRWWLITLFGSIFFGLGYWLWYETFAVGDNPMEAYQLAVLESLDKGGPVHNEDLLEIAEDRNMVAAGAGVYATYCVKCHGKQGEGAIGPNLTDPNWLHGGAPVDIYTSIHRGQTGKGMPAWGPQLGPGVVKQLTAHILSIRDTNVPGKAPQGTIYVPETDDQEPETETENQEPKTETENQEPKTETDGQKPTNETDGQEPTNETENRP